MLVIAEVFECEVSFTIEIVVIVCSFPVRANLLICLCIIKDGERG